MKLITAANPNMSSYFLDNDKGERENLTEKNFRIAFSVEGYYEPK